MGFQINMFTRGVIVASVLPFAISKRQSPYPVDYQAFAVVCSRAGVNPASLNLV
jgi:hypothetical protein